MYIGFNKYQVIGKIIMLIIFYYLIGLFIYYHPPIEFDFNYMVIFLLLIWSLVIGMFVFMTFQLLFFPKGVEVDTENQLLVIHFFLMKPKILSLNEISDYSTTKLVTKSTEYEGILVHSKTGRKYLFDDISISDYKPIKSLLDDCQINCAGHEKFNNVSYFITFFKYK